MNFIKRNTQNVILMAISLLVLTGYYFFKRPEFTFESDVSYNLLTINAVFVGFLYTMLGNIIEFTSRKDMAQQDRAGYMDNYYNSVYFGITFFFLSICISISFVFFNFGVKNQVILFLEKSLTVLGILFFIKSAVGLRELLNEIRKK